MNLFDTDGRMEDVGPGYRMRRLEVYNWGTFDGVAGLSSWAAIRRSSPGKSARASRL